MAKETFLKINIQDLMYENKHITISACIAHQSLLCMWFIGWINGEIINLKKEDIQNIINNNSVDKTIILTLLLKFYEKHVNKVMSKTNWEKHLIFLTKLSNEQKNINKKHSIIPQNIINKEDDIYKKIKSFVYLIKIEYFVDLWNTCLLNNLHSKEAEMYGYLYMNNEEYVNRFFSGHCPMFLIKATNHVFYSIDDFVFCYDDDSKKIYSYETIPCKMRKIMLETILNHKSYFIDLLYNILNNKTLCIQNKN